MLHKYVYLPFEKNWCDNDEKERYSMNHTQCLIYEFICLFKKSRYDNQKMEWHQMNETENIINEIICLLEKSRYDHDEDGMMHNEWFSMSHKLVYLPLRQELIR